MNNVKISRSKFHLISNLFSAYRDNEATRTLTDHDYRVETQRIAFIWEKTANAPKTWA